MRVPHPCGSPLAASLLLLSIACSGDGARVEDPSPGGADPSDAAAANEVGGPLYAAVAETILDSCSFFRCHGGPTVAGAGLYFDRGQSVRRALVNVTSCEYPLMKRVSPGDPDHSWILVKLTAPVADEESEAIEFTPAPGWMPQPSCSFPSADGGPGFGLRMPATDQFQLDPARIQAIRAWIEAGAPGPE